MTDLIERLREARKRGADCTVYSNSGEKLLDANDLTEAADEIASLRRKVGELEDLEVEVAAMRELVRLLKLDLASSKATEQAALDRIAALEFRLDHMKERAEVMRGHTEAQVESAETRKATAYLKATSKLFAEWIALADFRRAAALLDGGE